MKIIAVYPGRFQPFHKGHSEVYKWLKQKFGQALIATSNKVEPPKSPFNFSEKKQMMELAGVTSSDIKEVKNPYIATEILEQYDPQNTVLVFAISEKDMQEDPRFSFKPTKSGAPSYLQPFPKNRKDLQPFGDPKKPRGYVIVTPTFQFNILGEPMKSATELRKQFADADSSKQKKIITDLYGKYSTKVHKLMSDKIKKQKSLSEARTQMFYESITHEKFGPMLDSFVSFASDKLGLKSVPKLSYKTDMETSFGGYNPSTQELVIATKNRHPMDVFRTVAHELVHHKQNEDGRLGKDIEKEGATGSDIENEANAEAGKVMRWFAKSNPDMFKQGYVVENNTAAISGGVRGLGNVTGEVSPTGVSQYVIDNEQNATQGLWNFKDDNSWMDKDGRKDYHKKTFKAMRSRMNMNEMKATVGPLTPRKEPESFASSLPKIKGGAVTKLVTPNIQSNMPELKDGPRIKEPQVGATVTDTIVNGKKQKSISFDPNVGMNLEEGINDPGIFKAVFLAGGPGSGKDFIMKQTIEGNGLTEINSDVAFEFLMKKGGLDFKMPPEEEAERNIVRGRAKNMTKEMQRLALLGRKGVIINGTADDPEKLMQVKSQLEDMGYDTMMVFVNTSDEVSKQRNIDRGKGGGREVPEDIRKEKWEAVQSGKPILQKIFGEDRFVEIDNSADLRTANVLVKNRVVNKLNKVFKMVRSFTVAPTTNPNASSWIEKEIERQGIKDFKPSKAATSYGQQKLSSYAPPTSQSVMDKARAMGLEYYGFGRFGKNREVIYLEKNGQLVLKPKNIREESQIDEDLRKWFREKWVRFDTKGNIKGDCAREPGEGKPKCRPLAAAQAMSKDERAKSARRKRREDPVADRKGKGQKPVFVRTEEVLNEKNVPTNPSLWSKAKSLAKSKFDVYPSAYANGWASKWYKSKGGGWKSVSEEHSKVVMSRKGKVKRKLANVDEAFCDYMNNTSADREFGTDSLANIYKNSTPGQGAGAEAPDARKRTIVRKKLTKEDSYNRLNVPTNNGIGPEFSIKASPALVFGASGTGISESIINWANKPETQAKFVEKYGDLAEHKLTEAMNRLQEAGLGRDTSAPKSIKKIREWAKEPKEMGIYSGRGDDISETSKEDIIDTSKIKSLKSYKKEIHPESEFEKKAFKEESAAWQRKEGKDPKGGLNRKGIASYRRENPGSKLSMAVTTPPSKLDPKGKAAKRRKSFCARMGGMPGPMKDEKGRPTRKALALRKWNCEE